VRLEPLVVWFQPAAGALLPQLRPFLLAAGQAQVGPGVRLLRWAITAAEPARGLRIEAVLLLVEPGASAPITPRPRFGFDPNPPQRGGALGQTPAAGQGPLATSPAGGGC